tara:strand:- start:2491 stop:2658 length:168 start_codon:yes stop_codon:yes gene_type:complete
LECYTLYNPKRCTLKPLKNPLQGASTPQGDQLCPLGSEAFQETGETKSKRIANLS